MFVRIRLIITLVKEGRSRRDIPRLPIKPNSINSHHCTTFEYDQTHNQYCQHESIEEAEDEQFNGHGCTTGIHYVVPLPVLPEELDNSVGLVE